MYQSTLSMAYSAWAFLAVFAAGAPHANYSSDLSKRGCECQFPTKLGLVPITPEHANKGWAMSPNQACSCGSWCPYACPSGSISGQFDPHEKQSPSMRGGFWCHDNGEIKTPRPDSPYCIEARGEVMVKNLGSEDMHICQTVMPGNEAMLIPNKAKPGESMALAIPDMYNSFGPGHAAHYFVNPHGVPEHEACTWASKHNAFGNWAPYTFGVNRDKADRVFLATGWNPVYLEHETPFRNDRPSFGFRIDCPKGGCKNSDCGVDPSIHEVNDMSGGHFKGAGDPKKGPDSRACIASAPKEKNAGNEEPAQQQPSMNDDRAELGAEPMSAGNPSTQSSTGSEQHAEAGPKPMQEGVSSAQAAAFVDHEAGVGAKPKSADAPSAQTPTFGDNQAKLAAEPISVGTPSAQSPAKAPASSDSQSESDAELVSAGTSSGKPPTPINYRLDLGEGFVVSYGSVSSRATPAISSVNAPPTSDASWGDAAAVSEPEYESGPTPTSEFAGEWATPSATKYPETSWSIRDPRTIPHSTIGSTYESRWDTWIAIAEEPTEYDFSQTAPLHTPRPFPYTMGQDVALSRAVEE